MPTLILLQSERNGAGTNRGLIIIKDLRILAYHIGMKPEMIFFENHFPHIPPKLNSLLNVRYYTRESQPIKEKGNR